VRRRKVQSGAHVPCHEKKVIRKKAKTRLGEKNKDAIPVPVEGEEVTEAQQAAIIDNTIWKKGNTPVERRTHLNATLHKKTLDVQFSEDSKAG